MADNPFDINQLNNINFSSDELAKVSGYEDQAVVPHLTANVGVHEVDIPRSVGTITVIDSTYTAGVYVPEAGYYDPAVYHLPTFGVIQFSNITDGSGNPINFYIHGFNSNQLFLTTVADAQWIGSGGSNFTSGYGYVLALDGFSGRVIETTFVKDPTVFCFAEGTLIHTAQGLVAVEDLAIGDLAVTAAGAQRPVKWIGHVLSRPGRHPRPWEVNPIRVAAHAFGPGAPDRDLRLSPGHAVYVDGVLVPVGHLVNGATIVQEEAETIRYFHVELDTHDVLLANGLPCESYLDDGNRFFAANASEFTELYGRLDPQSWDNACAPLVAEGPQLTEIRERLHARAEVLGWSKSEEPDLVVEAGGKRYAPQHRSGDRYWFQVPAAETLSLRSSSGLLGHVLPSLTDERMLGVAVGEIRIDGAALDLEDAALGEGFYPLERHEGHAWRWTNGAAELKLGLSKAAMIEISLVLVAPSWKRDTPQLRVVA